MGQGSVESSINKIFSKLGVYGENSKFNPRVKSVLLYQQHTPDYKNPFDQVTLLDTLLTRQKEVADLIGQGYSNGEIVKRLTIKPKTVENYVNQIYQTIPKDILQGYHLRVVIVLISQTKRIKSPANEPSQGEPNFFPDIASKTQDTVPSQQESKKQIREKCILDILEKESNLTNEEIRRRLRREYGIEITTYTIRHDLVMLIEKGEVLSTIPEPAPQHRANPSYLYSVVKKETTEKPQLHPSLLTG